MEQKAKILVGVWGGSGLAVIYNRQILCDLASVLFTNFQRR